MRIGVLGTGMVGSTLATKFAALGHDVKMGARDAKNDKAGAWAKSAGSKASHGTFADAAEFGEIVFNCTNGAGSLDALQAAGAGNLRGKVLVDVANPLDFSRGTPPSLFTDSRDSLAERIQSAFPEARVVKSLNTVNARVMVDPKRVPGVSDVFVCGNDPAAKGEVTRILKDWFGWPVVVDLGDITAARATEAYLLLWLRLWGAFQTADVNVHVVH
jgi:8-hydroxy-5-deazaflavin:NADPH oxidoreductase